MIKPLINTCFFFTILNFQLQAQDYNELSNSVEPEIVESIAENAEGEIDISTLTEELQFYNKHPLDLNIATAEDFEKLGLLTAFQISSIIEYRQKNGKFLSVYELNGVPGFSVVTVKTILPFVTVKHGNLENDVNYKPKFNQQLLTFTGRTLESQKGYSNPPDSIKQLNPNLYYPGNSYHVKLKYNLAYGSNFQSGISMEKDPGETWFSGTNKTFDFTSAYLQAQDLKHIKNIIIGDYTANFGQGLVLWSGFTQGITANTVNIVKTIEGFGHYSSFDENHYLRGLAGTFHSGCLELSSFYSSKHIDAHVSSRDSLGNVVEVSSLQNTGIHALPSEISGEDALGEKLFGGNISMTNGRLRIGATYTNMHYSAMFKKADELYNYCSFSGNKLSVGSLNYLLRLRKAEFFGEAAKNSMQGKAFLNGVIFHSISELSIAIVYRYFEPEYFSAYANVFAQNSNPSNESGLYTGIEYLPVAKIKINAYADFFKNPFPKYQISSPSIGSNYFIAIFLSRTKIQASLYDILILRKNRI